MILRRTLCWVFDHDIAIGENALLVFDYIESQLHFIAQVYVTDSAEQRTSFCSELVKVAAELFVIDAQRTTRIVCSQLTSL